MFKRLLLMLAIMSNGYFLEAQTLLGNVFEGASPGDNLGQIVSMSADGQRIAISTPSASGGGVNRGEVAIYDYIGGSWIQVGATINGEDDQDLSGAPMKLSGDGTTVAIGSVINADGGAAAGHVRVFRYNSNNSTWEQIGSDIDGTMNDELGLRTGLDLSNDGNIVAIGYPNRADSGAILGGASVFDFTNDNWVDRGLLFTTLALDVRSGYSVSLNNAGTHMILGGVRADNNSGFNAIRSFATNNVTAVASFFLFDGTSLGFASSMNGDGTIIVAGDPDVNTVRIYTQDVTSTLQIMTQLGGGISGDNIGDRFGTSVDIDATGHRIVIGAESHSNNRGLVRIYDYNTSSGSWVQYGNDIVGDSEGDFFGASVAISDDGNYVVIGGTQEGSGNGVTKVYLLNETNEFVSSGNSSWGDTNNWSLGRVPSSIDNIVITSSENLVVDVVESFVMHDLTIEANANLQLSGSLTVNGNLTNDPSSTLQIIANLGNPASLIVRGIATGDINYQRELSTNNWYLISPPVIDETIGDFISNQTLDTSGNNIGLAPYINNIGDAWSYFQTGQDYSATAMESGKGYSVKPFASGNIGFTGAISTENVMYEISQGTASGFNLIGNPYASYISVTELLNTNELEDNDFLTEATVWLWDQSTDNYEPYNLSKPLEIAPGQGFFVSANGSHNFQFLESMQSHHSSNTFHRHTDNRPEIRLTINTNDGMVKDTDIYYIEGTIAGFDNGYDSTLFGGVSNSFAVYTHLVSDSEGLDYKIQSLPPEDYESMVIPVGLNAVLGTQLTFNISSANLPSGIHVYLEDRVRNEFVLFNDPTTTYEVTLDTDHQGIGRFYLHTTSSTLDLANPLELSESVSLYTINSDRSTLRLTGLSEGELAKVTIYNILGNMIYSQDLIGRNSFNDLSMPKLSTGIYIVRLSTDRGYMSKKILL